MEPFRIRLHQIHHLARLDFDWFVSTFFPSCFRFEYWEFSYSGCLCPLKSSRVELSSLDELSILSYALDFTDTLPWESRFTLKVLSGFYMYGYLVDERCKGNGPVSIGTAYPWFNGSRNPNSTQRQYLSLNTHKHTHTHKYISNYLD